MTHRIVRHQIRLWAREVFSVPFFDSINRDIAPPHDSIWATVEFDPAADTPVSFCDDILASGLADFIFAGPPGVGDEDVLAAAEDCIAKLLNRARGTSTTLAYMHQPEEFSNGTADHNYRVFIGVEYRFYYRLPVWVAQP